MCKSIIEYAWRVSQQCVIYPNNTTDGSNIKGWGSGFFIKHKERVFFVTADHCIHGDDHDLGLRLGKDDNIYVYNNINTKELTTLIEPMGCFYDFTGFKMPETITCSKDIKLVENYIKSITKEVDDIDNVNMDDIPDSIIDVACCLITKKPKNLFYTTELKVEEEVICKEGKEKFIIPSSHITNITDIGHYFVVGRVLNEVKNTVVNNYTNAIYADMSFSCYSPEGNVIMHVPFDVDSKKWEGLSGSPVFSDMTDGGKLVGMLIRAVNDNNTCVVIPIKKIIEILEKVILLETISNSQP